MPTVVEFLAETFERLGTPFIVGHPGGESVELMDACRRRGMRFILMKQETAGAMLASTWGELTGSPGVCLSTRGPGASNMVNGIAHAFLDRCPLIAITDAYSADVQETGLRQRLDHRQLYMPITKWSFTLQASVADQQLRRAALTATSGVPGPVHVDLPQSETTKPVGNVSAAPFLPDRLADGFAEEGLSETMRILGQSRKPILLVGMGVLWSRAAGELVAFAERLGAPVLTTTKAKGVIPEDHALSAGCIIGGLIERDLVNQSDLIVCVGLDAVELQPKPWPFSQPVLSISTTAATDGVVPASWSLVCDTRHALSALTSALSTGTGWGLKAANGFRKAVSAALDRPTVGLSPQRAIEVARNTLPRDTIVTCDAGASRLLIVQKWRSFEPRGFLTSNGLASMGYAVPGALAARLAHPDRPVVAFTGDGGFLMAVAEIQTSVKEKLPITVIILDDGEIGLIRVKQEIKQVERYGIALGGIDWEKLAQGFGADGVVVDNEAALESAIKASTRSTRTTLIAIKIDSSGYVDQFNALREL